MTASLPSLADSLIQALHQPGQERLLDLVRNPLRLTLLCITWDGTLPETQAQLYENYLKKFYGWNQNLQELRDCAKRCQTNITALKKQLNQQLGELAKAALNLPQERFRLSQALVEKYLGEELDDQSLCHLALQLGWLNRVGKDNRGQFIFAFYHATFQEYFAALAVDDWDYFLPRNHVNFPVAGKEYRIFEAQWKQVILLWLGRGDVVDEEKEGFIEKLVNFDDGCGEWNFEQVDRRFYEYRAYFLAAAGISEFKSCSLASEIVEQVVKCGFGYFNIEKEEWQTFFDPISETARQVLPETLREKAITKLTYISQTTEDEDTCRQVAESLGNIDPGNPQAITDLVRIIETSEDKDTRRQAAESLGKIGQGNSQVITDLVRIIEISEDKDTYYCVLNSLEKIGHGNPQVITVLVRIIKTIEDKLKSFSAAMSLGKIGQSNPQAIAAVVEILETTQNKDTRFYAAYSLKEIGQGNPQAIAAVIEILETTQNEDTRFHAADVLAKIGQGNPQAIADLVKIIETSKDIFARSNAIQSLEKIGQRNPQAIAALLKIIETVKDGNIRVRDAHTIIDIETSDNLNICVTAAISLGKIDPGNSQATDTLIKIIETIEDGNIRVLAAYGLGEIGQGNPQIIAALVRIIETTEDVNIRSQAAVSLTKIGQGNPQAIAALVRIIETTQNMDTCLYGADRLKIIIITNAERINVISALKLHLSDETYESNFKIFENCYKVIWNIAQDLPYPDFYRAWHGLTEIQTLNLAQLPQLLQTQLTETNLQQTLQLLCIDGSKFDNCDNPATDIYLQLIKKHHCPKSTEGTPRTLTELKIYWQLLDWEKHPILIFYEEAKPQGFSQTFLDFLDRFDATICVITDSPHPSIPTFSPQDPHLIQSIMNWLQRTILES